MSRPLRHLTAIRTRLVSDPAMFALVGTRVYLSHIFDVREPVYPCVCLSQVAALRMTTAPRTYQAVTVQVDCYSKGSQPALAAGEGHGGLEEVALMNEQAQNLLHQHKTATSTPEACFHEIRQDFEDSGGWDETLNAWRQTSRYLVRVTVS